MPDSRDVNQLLGQMANNLRSLLALRSVSDPLMIGIHTGGVWVAQALHSQLGLSDPLGTLNISFYRDDFTRIGMHPQVQPSSLPFEVENRHVILVDDVLHTGRTIRAALNEIFDYGRPASVILACLIDRGGKELPVCADIVGEKIELLPNQHIKLTGPEPLQLTVQGEK
ncbi:MAG: bifunctional pyr operon transcriptional regulator/uracil phosphoribosyltransferase PyrR [Gammaproteobacteria bacterium]|nr:bifunctional pyr operon transcriptional regulator/uracil phosphoribosyltransferase PyrR [Gammaproteobacteria bacterium]